MPRKKRKTRSRKAAFAPDHWPPPEREQHAGGTLVEERELTAGGIATIRGRRARAECQLDSYRNLGLIEARQWEAGLTFRRIASIASLDRPVTASYEFRVPGQPEMSDASIAARMRLRKALAILSENEAAIVTSTCIHDEPARERMPDLRSGLDGLADWLRLPD